MEQDKERPKIEWNRIEVCMGNHADNENNNRCDALAVAERDKFSL